ncbi:hypothetical protein BH24ACI1_BH24ACI1_29450 [soil metagenome]|nr:hypothetical protein [Pyrinomonadaceae bacterium]
MNVKKSTDKTFENETIETKQFGLQVGMNSYEFKKFSVRSRELGINKNLNYDNIRELIEQIEGVLK